MAIIRRENSDKLYYKFVFEGKQIFRSAKTTNEEVAKKRERECRNKLEKEAAMPADQKPLAPAPTLKVFAALPTDDDKGGPWWVDFATDKYAKKPKTLAFYEQRLAALLGFDALASARLDEIDEALLDRFATYRGKSVSGTTINRDFAALRLIMNRARRWKLIRGLPEFPHFKEKKRGRVVTPVQEQVYLAAVNDEQKLFFLILVDTAAMPDSVARLEWKQVEFDAVGSFKRGYIHDSSQKTEARERDLPMSVRVHAALKERWMKLGRPTTGFVFPADRGGSVKRPTSLSTFQSVHKRLWMGEEPIKIPRFRLYDLRHTCLTRMRTSGADAFDLKQAAGWSSIRMADTYIHADDVSKAKAFDRLNAHIEDLTSGRAAQ